MEENKILKYIVKIIKYIILIYTLFVFFDLLLFISGHKTFIIHTSPKIVNIAIASALLGVIIILVEYINMITSRKWKKILLTSLFLITILIICGISIEIAENKAIKKAYHSINQLFENNSQSFNIKYDKGAKELYYKFLSYHDEFSIKLNTYSLINGSYIFLIKAPNFQPFFIKLSTRYQGEIFYIYKDPINEIKTRLNELE